MFLLDTNVWLEILLEQEKADEAQAVIERTHPTPLAISELSLYSIGIILTRLQKDDLFSNFLSDTIEETGVARIRLEIAELKQTLSIHQRFKLDFDDAYQYVAAEKHGLTLVSFDSDFDRTDRGRKTPAQLLAEL